MKTITIIISGLIALVQGQNQAGQPTKEWIALLVKDTDHEAFHTAQIAVQPPAEGFLKATGVFDARLLDGDLPATPQPGSIHLDHLLQMEWFEKSPGQSYGAIAPSLLERSLGVLELSKVTGRVRFTADSVDYRFNCPPTPQWTPKTRAGAPAPETARNWPIELADSLVITVQLRDPKLEVRRNGVSNKYQLQDGTKIVVSNEPSRADWEAHVCGTRRLSHFEHFYKLSSAWTQGQDPAELWSPTTEAELCNVNCQSFDDPVGTAEPIRCPSIGWHASLPAW